MLNNNRITLKNIRHSKLASEETEFFRATVLFDGVPVCEASNDGHGGCNLYSPLKGQTNAELRAGLDKISAWIFTLPPFVFHGEELTHDLDTIVGEVLDAYLSMKDLQRFLKGAVLFVKPGQKGVFKVTMRGLRTLPPDQVARLAAKVKLEHPGARVLNELPESEALALYMADGDC